MATSTVSPIIMRIMAASIKTSVKAASIIRDVLKTGDLGIVDKSNKNDTQIDPQTLADRSAQRCIIASLTKKFPSVKIIGEEGDSDLNVPADWLVEDLDEAFLQQSCPTEWKDAKPEDFVIWVDPLDGTAEYTQGFVEHVTVLIGIAVKNAAVGGVIHQPFYKHPSGELGRTIWGLKGLGTGGFTQILPPTGQFIITTTRSHSNALHQQALNSFNATQTIKVGGAGFKVLQLLEGKAHAYVFATPGCKKWDTCAPEAVLEAQGGTLTDIDGHHYAYNASVEHINRKGVLATVCQDHAELVAKIPFEVRQAVGNK
ncbi:3'(2'),5'-bisphosphate nucleotidase 1 [Drosophila tropicalis]|uniref:3'(2'),5'-bisphosphate nucleotidase 1 n=1 Tax=Drosophila tropicalis TaxID=46794 RepID=UPI0035AB9F01